VLHEAAKFDAAIGRVFETLQVNVDQFYGIEIEEFPAQVAQTAMWLTDHQMNVEACREFGEFFARIPLEKSANIRHGNALRLDWEALVPPDRPELHPRQSAVRWCQVHGLRTARRL
jgi:hypothetical protein